MQGVFLLKSVQILPHGFGLETVPLGAATIVADDTIVAIRARTLARSRWFSTL